MITHKKTSLQLHPDISLKIKLMRDKENKE